MSLYNTSLSLVATILGLSSTAFAANILEGKCPELSQNKPMESFKTISMAGLWYEYVWDKNFDNELDYLCSSHIWLQDENPNSFYIFNTMYHPKVEIEGEEEDENKESDAEEAKPRSTMSEIDNPSSFYGYSLLWEPATEEGQRAKAYYTRNFDSVPNIDQD